MLEFCNQVARVTLQLQLQPVCNIAVRCRHSLAKDCHWEELGYCLGRKGRRKDALHSALPRVS